ncbi:sorting nexin-32-like isoform X2 [Stegodyphus dumicola]|nr:sorting nexin-32-like isoform X2 [Stegodyphus dumicola]XP_035216497.1 sorting nexin-32-like isoform X2 [Stegodyphus dumicola]XP_035216498.1 sorting nexin-32-like isoform X2 [Stegodyphus dumicola]
MEENDPSSVNHCKNDDPNSFSEPNSPTLETVSGFSTCSSPVPPEPFEPLFSVKFSGTVEKDGDIVKYTIKSIKKNGDVSYVVQRQYEDFEWLEHCLLTSNPLPGLIIPPLPPKPAITSEMAEAKSKRQLGSDTKTLIGDQFNKDCLQLEQYLRLLLSHCLFGRDEILEKFLTEKEPPPRAKVKRGIFSRISESFEGRKSSHRDCEEFFQKERDCISKYSVQIKETNEAFCSVVYSQQRLCNVLGHLATALTLAQCSNENAAKLGNKLCSLFSEALEDARHGLQVLSYNDENTLGAYLDLYTRYIESEKEMLLQRTCLLVEYENANKALDKAKPQKKAAAEEAKFAAEKAFEDCSDVARQEIKKFHRQRVKMFQESLEKFAEAQLRNARDVTAMLAKSLTKIKQFEIDL